MLRPFVLVLLAAAILLPNVPAGRSPHEDAGVFLYAGSVVLGGGLPYRDVWDHKPPGVYYLSALGLLLGGGAPLGVWLLEFAALALAAIAGYAALARAFGWTAAFAGSVAWLVTTPRLFLADGYFTTFAELFALPLQLAALALAARAGSSARRDVAIGALGGVALLLKPTLVGLWIALVVVAAVPLVRSRDWPALARRLLPMGAGGLLPATITAVYFVARDGAGDLWDQAIAYNLANGSTATFADRFDAVRMGLRLTAPTGLIALGLVGWLGAALALRRGLSRVGAAPTLLAVALVDLPLEIVLSSAPGRPYHYYYLAWLPALAVFAAFVAKQLLARISPRRAAAALAVALVVMSVRPTMLVVRVAGTVEDGTAREAAEYVRAHSEARDRVLLWGSRTEVNFLTGRDAPTRFVYQYAPLFTVGYARAERIDELVRDLSWDPPTLIVDASSGSPVTPPLDRAGLLAWVPPDPRYVPPPEVERVAAFVAARYERVATLPQTGWPVYRLRGTRR